VLHNRTTTYIKCSVHIQCVQEAAVINNIAVDSSALTVSALYRTLICVGCLDYLPYNFNANNNYSNSFKIAERAVSIVNSVKLRAVGLRACRYAMDGGLCDHGTVHCGQCHR
jgi:hypothetical protein